MRNRLLWIQEAMSQENLNKFNPYRLRLARNCRRMTKKELAEKINISPLTLTRLEKGENEPHNETIFLLSSILGFPKEFFLTGSDDEYQNAIYLTAPNLSFRGKASIPAKEREAAHGTEGLAYIFDQWIQEHFNLPEVDLPDYSDGFDPETAAEKLRHKWIMGIHPIPNLLKLLEAKGIRIFCYAEPYKNIDAFSYWRNGIPYIFLNTMISAERIRFNASHELGHLILHRNLQTSDNSILNRDAEKEANLFAGAFLMPEADIRAHIFTSAYTDQLVQAKQRWKVSVAALAYRLRQLELLSEWNYRTLAIDIQRRGFRTKEPNPIEYEYSSVWEKIFQILWKEKITRATLAKKIHISEMDINKLVNGLLPHVNHERNKNTPNPAPVFKVV